MSIPTILCLPYSRVREIFGARTREKGDAQLDQADHRSHRFGIGACRCRAVADAAAFRAACSCRIPPNSTSNGDIIVERRSDAELHQVIAMLTATNRSSQIAHSNGAICPKIFDLDDAHAKLIVDRIDTVASGLGIGVEHLPCAATIVIVVSPDANAFAHSFLERYPGLFGDPKYGIHHHDDLARLEAPRPVRWFDAAITSDANGMRLTGGDAGDDVSVTHSYNGGSRISRPTRQNSTLAFAIVDAERLAHITWGQLADYLTLVTLARPALGAEDHDSVLSIFAARDAGRKGPAGLSGQDFAVLKALYHSDPALDATQQRAQIASRVRRAERIQSP